MKLCVESLGLGVKSGTSPLLGLGLSVVVVGSSVNVGSSGNRA